MVIPMNVKIGLNALKLPIWYKINIYLVQYNFTLFLKVYAIYTAILSL